MSCPRTLRKARIIDRLLLAGIKGGEETDAAFNVVGRTGQLVEPILLLPKDACFTFALLPVAVGPELPS